MSIATPRLFALPEICIPRERYEVFCWRVLKSLTYSFILIRNERRLRKHHAACHAECPKITIPVSSFHTKQRHIVKKGNSWSMQFQIYASLAVVRLELKRAGASGMRVNSPDAIVRPKVLKRQNPPNAVPTGSLTLFKCILMREGLRRALRCAEHEMLRHLSHHQDVQGFYLRCFLF